MPRSILAVALLLTALAQAADRQPPEADTTPRLRLLEPIPEHPPSIRSNWSYTRPTPYGDYDLSRHLYYRTYGPTFYYYPGYFYSYGYGWGGYFPRFHWRPYVVY